MASEDGSPTIACPHCGHTIYARARFCRRCGNTTNSAPPTCAKCGAVAEATDALFCSKCGAALSSSVPHPEMTQTCPSCGSTVPRAAKICGACNSYLPREAAVVQPQPIVASALGEATRTHSAMRVECPRCGSEQVQKLSVIYESGVAVVDTTSAGYGIGATGQGLGGGFGAAATRGVQVTALAAKAAPPARRNTGRPAIWMLFCGFLPFMLHWFESNGLSPAAPPMVMYSSFGIAALAFSILVSNSFWNSTEWPKLYQHWERMYMCNRCGTMLVVEEAEPKLVHPSRARLSAEDEYS